MSDEIKLSIIIPMYNVGNLICDTIKSIHSIGLNDIEIICVDDGSSDDTVKCLNTLIEKNNLSVKLLRNETNRGQAYARNMGLNVANGRFVYFMDADDYICNGKALKCLLDSIDDDCSGIFFDAELIHLDEYGNQVKRVLTQSFQTGVYRGIEIYNRILSDKEIWMGVWRTIWNKDYLERNEIRYIENTSPHEDLLFTFEAFVRANKIEYVKEKIYTYKKRDDSSTAGQMDEKRYLAHFRCYIEGIRFWEKYCYDEDDIVLLKYLRFTSSILKNGLPKIVRSGIDIWNTKLATYKELTLLRMYILQEYPLLVRIISPDEYNLMISSSKILIFGAGNTGRDVEKLLTDFGISNYKFTTTRGSETIELYSKDKSVPVILAAKNESYNEMLAHLEKMNFSHIIDLSA